MKLRIATIKKIGQAMTLSEFLFEEGLGANLSVFKEEELNPYIKRIKEDEKKKDDKYRYPYIHSRNIPIIDAETGEEYDLDSLKAAITTRPKKILEQNEKMKHSSGKSTQFYNIGLPALKGLVVNEGKLPAGKKNDFVVVDTCPGAGICKTYCYAKKGGYVQYAASSMAKSRVLNFLMNDPNGFKNELSRELEIASNRDKDVKIAVRWHDAGDIFSADYMKLAYEIAKNFPSIAFFAYTKMADVALSEAPENFKITFSEGSTPEQSKKVKNKEIRKSITVPFDLFKDLYLKKDGKLVKSKSGVPLFKRKGLDTLKDRMVEKYHLSKDSIITYSELLKKPKSNNIEWNVIVVPGEGDISATRADVRGIYLLFH